MMVDAKHKLLAVMLLVIAAASLLVIAVAPAIVLGARWSEDIEHKQLQLQKLMHAKTKLQQLQQRMEDTPQVPANNLIKAANASLAAAQLQSAMKNMVETSGGVVLRTQVVDDPALDKDLPFIPISLLMQMRGDINSLQRILYNIYQHQPDLFITRLQIDNRQFGHYNPAHDTTIMLTTSITIHGFMADEKN